MANRRWTSELCIAICNRCKKKQPPPVVQIDIPPWQENPVVLDVELDSAIKNAAGVAQQAASFAQKAASEAQTRVLTMKRSASVSIESTEWEVVGDVADSNRPGSV